MPIEAVTCPNCGASGIQIDTSREHSFCSYCGSTVKTKDVLHLDAESMTLEKLKRNAQKSFALGQYKNAVADWKKAIVIDRTDHESYFGVVRCDMARIPDIIISDRNKTGCYAQALAYAPPDVKTAYIREIESHNAKAQDIRQERQAKARKRDKRKKRRLVLIALVLPVTLLCGLSFLIEGLDGAFESLLYFGLPWTLLVLLISFIHGAVKRSKSKK